MPGQPRKRAGLPHADSGVDRNGHWTPAFPGQRRPFEPGHVARQTHGPYVQALHLQPRAEEIAEILRVSVIEPERFRVAIDSAAMVAARMEKAYAAPRQDDRPGEA